MRKKPMTIGGSRLVEYHRQHHLWYSKFHLPMTKFSFLYVHPYLRCGISVVGNWIVASVSLQFYAPSTEIPPVILEFQNNAKNH